MRIGHSGQNRSVDMKFQRNGRKTENICLTEVCVSLLHTLSKD